MLMYRGAFSPARRGLKGRATRIWKRFAAARELTDALSCALV